MGVAFLSVPSCGLCPWLLLHVFGSAHPGMSAMSASASVSSLFILLFVVLLVVLDEFRNHVFNVAHDNVVGNLVDRSVGVVVHRDDDT